MTKGAIKRIIDLFNINEKELYRVEDSDKNIKLLCLELFTDYTDEDLKKLKSLSDKIEVKRYTFSLKKESDDNDSRIGVEVHEYFWARKTYSYGWSLKSAPLSDWIHRGASGFSDLLKIWKTFEESQKEEVEKILDLADANKLALTDPFDKLRKHYEQVEKDEQTSHPSYYDNPQILNEMDFEDDDEDLDS